MKINIVLEDKDLERIVLEHVRRTIKIPPGHVVAVGRYSHFGNAYIDVEPFEEPAPVAPTAEEI